MFRNSFAFFILGILSTSCFCPPQNFEKNSELWNMANPKVDRSDLLEVNSKRHKVLVAVLDGGVDYNHYRFAKNLRPNLSSEGIGLDLIGQDYFPSYRIVDPEKKEEVSEEIDVKEHGTHVAGLALLGGTYYLRPKTPSIPAIKKDFGSQMGLLPIRLLPFPADYPEITKNMNADLAYNLIEYVAKALDFAVEQKAFIANMSIGVDLTKVPEEFRQDVLNKLEEKILRNMHTKWRDLLMVAAAGNEHVWFDNPLRSFPAGVRADNLISVGALLNNSTIANFSNNGPFVDVYIRGEDINSSIPENTRKKMSGTSMASPLVANLAAKVKILNQALSAAEVKKLIVACSDDKELKVAPQDGQEAVTDGIQKLTIKVVNFKKTLAAAKKYVSGTPLEKCP